jgi:acyl transferase domain-containing protein
MQDGKSASLTAPNGLAQEQLLRAALSDAGVSASEVSYIEAHGTGTKLGDPIETEALRQVYGADRSEDQPPLMVSGVKGNIGHLEAAAGIGGILSAVLALQHGEAPPNAQLHELNAKVAASVSGGAIEFPMEVTALGRVGSRRLLAGVSSFGYSGTIAHVLLEEAPEGHGRAVGGNVSVPRCAEVMVDAAVWKGLVWQFAGQGTLSAGVLKGVFESEAAFREGLATCDVILRGLLGFGATELLYPMASQGSVSEARAQEILAETRYSQAVLVALEYSLSQVWLSRGHRPSAVMGHSLGEYAAGVVAGVLSLEDCLRVVCERGRLMQESEACVGRMVAVRASAAEVTAAVEEAGAASEVSLAAVNGPRSVVVSGSQAGVDRVLHSSALTGCSHQPLKVSRAFHSPLMASVSDSFEKVLQSVEFHRPSIPMVSTVTGGSVDEEVTSVSYWLRHMMQPVLYQSAVELVVLMYQTESSGDDIACTVVEMGADSTLTKMGRGVAKSIASSGSSTVWTCGGELGSWDSL